MLFNSFEFIFFFLPIVLIGFFSVARFSRRVATVWLVAASLFFYGWWNPKFVALLLGSIAFNYGMARAITGFARQWAKSLLIGSIGANLVLLGVFKYANFFISTVNSVAGTGFGLTDVILPLGISFFTFTQIAFLVDVYRNIAHELDFVRYLLFVSYFPHLIAGPVLHHRQMMPQFAQAQTYRLNSSSLMIGISVFAIGLAKKVLLADSFSDYANPVFDAARDGSYPLFFVAWAGALAYTFQLYFDFSGYSDMAIGLSRMFGIVLPLNFNAPYKAPNIIEFWKRWHMTLSRFLRDYLYFPLGGNRLGKSRRYVNLMVTMLLGGLWHGASWTFVAWGGLHGLFLVINHAWQATRRRLLGQRPSTRITRAFAIGFTFLCVVFAWVFFRAETFRGALQVIKGMAGWNGFNLPAGLASLLNVHGGTYLQFEGLFADNPSLSVLGVPSFATLLVLGFALVWACPTTQQLFHFDHPWDGSVVAGDASVTVARGSTLSFFRALLVSLLFGISLISFSKASPFLYFQF